MAEPTPEAQKELAMQDYNRFNQSCKTPIELPAFKLPNTSFTIKPLPNLTFGYGGPDRSLFIDSVVEKYWIHNVIRTDILCHFLTDD